MDQVKALETLKNIKKMARSQHNCSRVIYSNKLARSSNEHKKIYSEAIHALDAMCCMYESLKTGLRREPFLDQIEFTKKWHKYISCIDSITAHKTKDKHLLEHPGIVEEQFANKIALAIWQDFSSQLKIKKTII